MNSEKIKFKIIFLLILIFGIFGLAKSSLAADYFVSQTGSGLKNGASVDNAWAGWGSINWDTDGTEVDTGVGGGDKLYVVGTVRATTYAINGYGLSESQRLTITSYPDNPGKIWQGLEITGSGWTGPDEHGAYVKSVSYPTGYNFAVEWLYDPWSDAVNLKTMSGVPDASWDGASGLYYCDSVNKLAYYKPTSGGPGGKTLTAWASTSRVFQISQKDYVTISGLILNNPILIYNSTDSSIIENNEISCTGTQTGLPVGYGHGETGNNNGIIRGNYIHDCGNGIYFVNQGYDDTNNHNNWVVENNYIANIHGTSDSHAIGIQGGTGNIFQYNHLFNAGSGITFWNQCAALSGNNQTLKNNIVRFNRVHHMGYYGTDNGNGRGIEFSGETADSNLTTGNLVYGNVVSDCTNVGIRNKNGILETGGHSIKIFNNTVSDCYYNYYILPSNYENFEVGAYLHNNISINPKNDGYHLFVQANGQTYDLSLDKNIYYGSGKFYYEAATHNNLSSWKTAMAPLDANSLDANPLLNASLVPQSGGSGIDTGEDLSTLTTLGLLPSTVFPSGVNNGHVLTADQSAYGSGWDIGAYEYVGTGDITPPAPPTGLSVN